VKSTSSLWSCLSRYAKSLQQSLSSSLNTQNLNELINKSNELIEELDKKMYKPHINLHGKPYGAYPYGATASGVAMQQQNNQLNHLGIGLGASTTTISTSGGLLSGGLVPVGNSIVSTSGAVTFTVSSGVASTTFITKQGNKSLFTANNIEKLKVTEPRKITKKIADYVEPITAWRSWSVKNLKLIAIGTDYKWEPMKKMEAECVHHSHAAPTEKCTCGIWAFKSLDLLLPAIAGYSNVSAIGSVSIWGNVIETENGYRAQYAYPKEIWILDETLEGLGYNYNVPIRLYKAEISDKDSAKSAR